MKMRHYTQRFTNEAESTVFDQFSKIAFKSFAESLNIKIVADYEQCRTGKDAICDGSTVPAFLQDTLVDGMLLVETTSRNKKSYDKFVGKEMPDSYQVLPYQHCRDFVFCNIPARRYKLLTDNGYVPVEPYSIFVEFPYPEDLHTIGVEAAILKWKQQGYECTIWKYKDFLPILAQDGEGKTRTGDDCIKMPFEFRFRFKNRVRIPEKFASGPKKS